VVPLMLASGAGAASRQSIGTTVFGGMLAATLLSLALVPVFYALIERLREGRYASLETQSLSRGPGAAPAASD
jgi:Cu/Ag efflux pump CusA